MKDYEKMMKEMKNYEGFTTTPSSMARYVNAGWRNPGDELTLETKPEKEFPYTLSYKDGTKKFFERGKVKAENAEQARTMVEFLPKMKGMKKIWALSM